MQLGTQPCSPRARSRLRRPFGRNQGLRDYEPRDAEATVLHQLLSEHLLTFLERARDDDGGAGLPPFVVRELRGFLDCGVLAKGFARLRCDDCAFERLVPFSCKGRGFCPSCGGRRMTERAAHLVDAVLPDVPLRQWVLSLPHPIRALCAFDHRLSLKVLRIFTRALLTFQRRRAERAGIGGGRGGGVTVIQRFGGDLRLNLHFHNLTLDGVYYRTESGQLAFHPLPPPSDEEVARLLAKVRRRVLRLLQREGLLDDELLPTEAPHGGPSSALAALASASLRGLRALGPHAGAPILRIGRDPDASWVHTRGPLQAHLDGFDLHAAVSIQRGDPEGREALTRYLLRPAVAQDRLELLPNGDVQLELKTPWRDGTTHLCFEPLELIGRLASLVPRPHKNTLIYHGVLAARAKWRPEVVPGSSPSTAAPCAHGASHDATVTRACAAQPATTRAAAATPVAKPRRRHPRWAELMRRAFGIDVLECPRCFGRLRLLATIESPAAVVAILDHLGLPTRLPRLTPPRAPPSLDSAPTLWLDGVDPDTSWS